MDELWKLEEAGWRSLCGGDPVTHYDAVLTEDALMIVPGAALDRQTVLQIVDGRRTMAGRRAHRPFSAATRRRCRGAGVPGGGASSERGRAVSSHHDERLHPPRGLMATRAASTDARACLSYRSTGADAPATPVRAVSWPP
ncbi:hypothetical protein GCM10018962_43170 [Dactylosporangium matsuzakiense]|uniref:Uncharacterized protein n=1 Tax=Dactylosporangium matsuzakiense TaxID=53360 RepID=A0A9W6KFR1_9ACTN|nr:hypothetical protein GCM10017581_016050 [Dactylosporangium matsuzakiense]